MSDLCRVMHVVGARPNYMKVAPIIEAMSKNPRFQQTLVHTGQHYDTNMSELFFEELGMPQPDVYLGIGSASHATQTARIMLAFEPVLLEWKPDLLVVVGDVNSTLACALVASKLSVPIVHVEAGLRSFNRRMPEEINRIVTDALSDCLFTTESDATANLLREGIETSKIHLVGNVMADTLFRHLGHARNMEVPTQYGLSYRKYMLVTLHRPDNVDDGSSLSSWLRALKRLSEQIQVVFVVHPRTRRRITEFGLEDILEGNRDLIFLPPLGYLSFLGLMDGALFVATDSGGIQEETTILGVPCLTLRTETERPVTVSEGTNLVIGQDPERLIAESRKIIDGHGKVGRRPELWDGHAAERIVEVLNRIY